MTTPIPDYPVFGADVSKWQKALKYIDFKKMKDTGAGFVMMRAGFGSEPDRDINYNATESKNHFDIRGAYWFPDHRYLTTQYDQLQAMRAVWQTYSFELPLILDIEHLQKNNVSYFPGRSAAIDFYKPFIDDIKQRRGRAPMLYINQNAINVLSPLPAYMLECPLWIASWKRTTPLYSQWQKWTFWQTGVYERGPEFGCDSPTIDLNVYNGTTEDLYDFAGIADEPIIIPSDYDKRITVLENKVETMHVAIENLRTEYEDLLSVLRETYKDASQSLTEL